MLSSPQLNLISLLDKKATNFHFEFSTQMLREKTSTQTIKIAIVRRPQPGEIPFRLLKENISLIRWNIWESFMSENRKFSMRTLWKEERKGLKWPNRVKKRENVFGGKVFRFLLSGKTLSQQFSESFSEARRIIIKTERIAEEFQNFYDSRCL